MLSQMEQQEHAHGLQNTKRLQTWEAQLKAAEDQLVADAARLQQKLKGADLPSMQLQQPCSLLFFFFTIWSRLIKPL